MYIYVYVIHIYMYIHIYMCIYVYTCVYTYIVLSLISLVEFLKSRLYSHFI